MLHSHLPPLIGHDFPSLHLSLFGIRAYISSAEVQQRDISRALNIDCMKLNLSSLLSSHLSPQTSYTMQRIASTPPQCQTQWVQSPETQHHLRHGMCAHRPLPSTRKQVSITGNPSPWIPSRTFVNGRRIVLFTALYNLKETIKDLSETQ